MIRLQNLFGRKQREASRKFYIIFPSSDHSLCLHIAGYISNKFSEADCTAIEYEGFNKNTFKRIERLLRETCVLIIGYEGDLALENCYKLGIAYAHKRQVVLINLRPKNASSGEGDSYLADIPEYISYHFWIPYVAELPTQFQSRIENVIEIIISGDMIRTLYQKSIDICETIENNFGCSIDKVDRKTFEGNLTGAGSDVFKALTELYVDDDEKLHHSLLYLVVKNSEDVLSILRSQKETEKISEDFRTIKNYHIYGNQIIGSKIYNNYLDGASIDNFANEVKDDAQQRTSD